MPVLTPRLSAGWIGLVTPVSYRIARPLAEGLRNRVVVTKNDVQDVMPHRALDVRSAIRTALQSVRDLDVETRWSAAGTIPGDPQWAGGAVFCDERRIVVEADAPATFAAVCRIGGGNGWYAADILWRVRGIMDKAVGGPGLRRGRRHPERVEFGEALDFWRVIGLQRNKALALIAEMKIPGTAMLSFELTPAEGAKGRAATLLTMTARFRPKGLFGLLYWYRCCRCTRSSSAGCCRASAAPPKPPPAPPCRRSSRPDRQAFEPDPPFLECRVRTTLSPGNEPGHNGAGWHGGES